MLELKSTQHLRRVPKEQVRKIRCVMSVSFPAFPTQDAHVHHDSIAIATKIVVTNATVPPVSAIKTCLIAATMTSKSLWK